ncbi:triple tyrosine motif-containing protein [Tamlana sp. 2_MG-2023]|uniref:triple tyrosine motif-containing protein n=1 Tax=unclassified Tamlana TaxID=2614803 RepID=UPI0026E230EE|nr:MULTISPECIES: triple tyrosine motif-containing protein [unclassified Tamlana]MDO6759680.1 triple tyrosine motif-containing protein [Tamlana sp. 2_MG-2023]MDO6791303.1 triple tyrosine motif-containing protein [Tamlana sp. 1_MG-2023]
MRPLLFTFLIFILVSPIVLAQERSPIQIFSTKDYGAESQNWSISQSKDKFIYVANNKGLLEYNGAEWALYLSPNKTIMRSVNVIDSLIYTGSYRDFGYWNRNDLGKLDYTSLSDKLNISFLEDEEIWNIINVDNFILFQSLKRIYIYNINEETYSVINSNTTIYKIFKVANSIYFQSVKDGIYEIVNGTSKLVSDDVVVQENVLVNIFNHQGKLLFQTEDYGFFIVNESSLESWEIPANKEIYKNRIYNSIQLKDESFILGSISNGIFHMDAHGNLLSQIDQSSGLSNNTVLSVFEDVENNIWLGLENGVICINIKSPYKIFNDDKGNIGAVNASILYNNILYLGTNQGLFYKKFNSTDDFVMVEGTQGATWCLTKIGDTLFCGHNSGTFVIDGVGAKKVSDVLGTWGIKTIQGKDNLLIQGNYTGLYILENVNGLWQLRNKIQGYDMSTRYFEFLNTHEIFVSHEYKGVFKIKVDNDFTETLSVEEETSISKGLKTSLIKYNNKILYTEKKGVFTYNVLKKKFVRDSVLSGLFNEQEFTSGKLVNDIESNKLWAFSQYGLSYLTPGKLSNTPNINKISLPAFVRNDVSGYENISYLSNNNYLYGTSHGYIIINTNLFKDRPYQININLISNSTYDDGYKTQLHNKQEVGYFKNNENNIEVSYNIPEYKKYLVVEYQYKLEGIYDKWSDWSTKSSVLFKNLSYGHYKFYVRARLGNDMTVNTASYSFNIERPWYLSNMAFTSYILLIIVFSLFMHTLYMRYYKKQRQKILLKKERELEVKELENKQQLMRFNNDKLRQDIENKNRELSISTMSLIKKNEFLNSLKNDLQKVKEVKNINQVIKVIDRNLNNTDDWHVFQEAFNNVDKDFLKKIKSIHPQLTSNDLRLCAYLRLNLSSKEIAPLLNISPRSVEVKRYRLRKKMDLPHESSLTDYILEI